MLAYIDDSRSSGTAPGNRYDLVHVLAILSEYDIQHSLRNALDSASSSNAPSDNLSAAELPTGALLDSFFGNLEAQGNWKLFWARIDNSYAVSTWLVDIIFGIQDDPEIIRWYRDEVGRHILFLAIDGAITENTRARLVKARAGRNRAKIISCLKNVRISVMQRVPQEHIRTLLRRALDFAVQEPRFIQFSGLKLRGGIEDETAIQMACVTLLEEIASFLEKNGKGVVQVRARSNAPVSATLGDLLTLTKEIVGSLEFKYLYAIGLDPRMLNIDAIMSEDTIAEEEMMEKLGDLFRLNYDTLSLIALRKKYPNRITEYVVSKIASEMLVRDRLAMTRH